MTKNEVAAIVARLRELLAEATPGPLEICPDGVIWVAQLVPVAYPECCGCPRSNGECCGNAVPGWYEDFEQVQIAQANPADGQLFVEAINALPMLLDALAPNGDWDADVEGKA